MVPPALETSAPLSTSAMKNAAACPAWALDVELDEGAPVTVPLEASHYEIGRGEGSDVRLDDRTVSRRHAVLTRDAAGAWYVDDAGSRLGTFVQGRPIRARTPLGHGACLQLGDVLLTLRDTSGAATGALVGRFEPAGTYLRDGLVTADAPARLVMMEGPGVGSLLRLDDGAITIGGVPGSKLRLDAPGCEAVEVVVRPVADAASRWCGAVGL
jgi:hypothetical protein